jgi:hypothetical protein
VCGGKLRGKVGRGAALGRGGKERERGPAGERGAGLLGFISFTSSFLFFFYILSIQTIPFEFK